MTNQKVNQKVINATEVTVNGVKYRSKLEARCAQILKENNISFEYEPKTFELISGFTPLIPYYDEETPKQRLKRLKSGSKVIERSLIAKTSKIISLKYTPDIYVKYNNLDIWIEVKSIENDVFYIKKKLFIKLLGEELIKSGKKSMYFEIHSIKQLKQAIEIWKKYDRDNTK